MIILALDTTLDGCNVAVLKDGEVLGEQYAAQSNMVFSAVEDLLKTHCLTYQSIEAIAVTRGPGSFTGTRLGLAAAQGFCLGGQIPLWGLTTLDCLAYQAQESKKPLMVAISTKRNDFYVGMYPAGTFFTKNPKIMTVEDLRKSTSSYRVIVWAEPDNPIHQESSVEKVQLKALSVGQLALYAQQKKPSIFSGEPLYLRPAKVYEVLHGHND